MAEKKKKEEQLQLLQAKVEHLEKMVVELLADRLRQVTAYATTPAGLIVPHPAETLSEPATWASRLSVPPLRPGRYRGLTIHRVTNAGWRHLVVRPHPWRKQACLKGRNLTVGQLVASINANKFSEAEAAENYDVPVEAIEEALRYAKEHKDIIEQDADMERSILLSAFPRVISPIPG